MRVEWRCSYGARRRRDEHHLRHLREELVEAQRPVVERRRQPEAEVDERLLPRPVALVHAADLRHRLVRLVDEDDVVLREVVEQRVRRRAGGPAVEDPRVVLDPVAEAELLHHLEVVLGALPDAVRLEHLAFRLELLDLLVQLVLDLVDGALDRRLRRDVLRRREDGDLVVLREHLAGQRVEMRDRLDVVAEERDAVRRLRVRRLHLDDVALDAEPAAPEQRVVADVLDVDQLAQHQVAIDVLADRHRDDLLLVLVRRAEAVDARHRGDDDHVAPREDVRRRRVAQAVDVVVPRGVLLDVEVGLRDVRLGLVVVVVRDEVLDRVLREELAELVAELRRQRLVVGDDQRGPADLLDRPRHRRRLAGAGRADQRLEAVTRLEPARSSVAIAVGWSPVGRYAADVLSAATGDQPNDYPPRYRLPLAHREQRGMCTSCWWREPGELVDGAAQRRTCRCARCGRRTR